MVEVRILGRDDCLDERGRHVAFRDHDSLLNRVLREDGAIAIVDARDDRGLIVLERFDQREVNDMRQHEARFSIILRCCESGNRFAHCCKMAASFCACAVFW